MVYGKLLVYQYLKKTRISSSSTRKNKHEIGVCWERYHELREFIQSDNAFRVTVDIRSSVMSVINKDEPPHKA